MRSNAAMDSGASAEAEPRRPSDGPEDRGLIGLGRTSLMTYGFSALTLAANLLSGIVSARALGPSGRGVTVALVTVTQLSGFLFAMGVAQSLSYFVARAPEDAPSLFTTWMLMLAPCAAVAILAGELLLPVLFPHTPVALLTGRWFMFTILLVIAAELSFGLLLGAHDFTLYNVLRFAQPALMAVSFLALWRLQALTVTSALIAPTAASGVILSIGIGRSLRTIGLGPVRFGNGLRTLWYGVRGQGTLVATHVSARLDVAMLPAFVAAASVGLYSVATNVSLIIYQLSNSLAALLLPAAARDPDRGPATIIAALYWSLLVASVLAVAIGLLARPLLSVVYGSGFADAAFTLRLLLPGAVLFAGSSIVGAGVYAAGRPFIASVSQVVAALVTVVGLLLFLREGGITAAALVSTAAYATAFVTTLVAYKHVTGIPWRGLRPPLPRGGRWGRR